MRNSVFVLALLATLGLPALSSAKTKPKLATPVLKISAAAEPGNTIVINGGFVVKGKQVTTSLKWSGEQLFDASGAPLPLTSISGAGRTLPVPISGAHEAIFSAKATTAKMAAHKAATKSVRLTVKLGGYNAVGTVTPHFGSLDVNGPEFAYCEWPKTLTGDPATGTFRTSSDFMCPPTMGTCSWQQATTPSPPTDLWWGEGSFPLTELNVYGGKATCTNTSNYVEPMLHIAVAYYDNGQLSDSCELPLSGVTSFTIPPDWAGTFSAYAGLNTYNPDGSLYNSNQYTDSTPWFTKGTGAVEVCQAYHLPPLHMAGGG